MKPGFIPKSAKTYPLSPKETDAVKAFLDEHITVRNHNSVGMKRPYLHELSIDHLHYGVI
jgi:hypothetical protein